MYSSTAWSCVISIWNTFLTPLFVFTPFLPLFLLHSHTTFLISHSFYLSRSFSVLFPCVFVSTSYLFFFIQYWGLKPGPLHWITSMSFFKFVFKESLNSPGNTRTHNPSALGSQSGDIKSMHHHTWLLPPSSRLLHSLLLILFRLSPPLSHTFLSPSPTFRYMEVQVKWSR